MKKVFIFILSLFFIQSFIYAQLANDNAGNYGGGWVSGSNEGAGFGPWQITFGGNAGVFLGDPAAANISGMSDPSFALYANPAETGIFVNADRSFSSPMPVGSTFRFDWGVNFDSGGIGNKGFNLYTGGAGVNQLININQGGSQVITINGDPMFSMYGTQAMRLYFEYQNANTIRVYGTGRDGSEEYDQTFFVSGAPDAFRFYASDLVSDMYHDERQPYFNNLLLEAAMPVSFIKFTASTGAGVNHLYWEYQATPDFEAMIVEHSIDSRNWEEIYWEPSTKNNYGIPLKSSFVHNTPPAGENYYRLRAISINGEERLSAVRMVYISPESLIRPVNNLVRDELILERPVAGAPSVVYVMDLNGRRVHTFELGEGSGTQSFDVSFLKQGFYLLHIISKGESKVFKIVKQ